ncbi:hypothetical protein QYF36_005994 [Acer negundo]|nr:hypothetical protein QYF36_005994 [Acer negundo]
MEQRCIRRKQMVQQFLPLCRMESRHLPPALDRVTESELVPLLQTYVTQTNTKTVSVKCLPFQKTRSCQRDRDRDRELKST